MDFCSINRDVNDSEHENEKCGKHSKTKEIGIFREAKAKQYLLQTKVNHSKPLLSSYQTSLIITITKSTVLRRDSEILWLEENLHTSHACVASTYLHRFVSFLRYSLLILDDSQDAFRTNPKIFIVRCNSE